MTSKLKEAAEQRQGRPAPSWYSVADAARILGVGEETLRRCVKAGCFPALHLGISGKNGRYLIPARALEALEERALTGWTLVEAGELATGNWDASTDGIA